MQSTIFQCPYLCINHLLDAILADIYTEVKFHLLRRQIDDLGRTPPGIEMLTVTSKPGTGRVRLVTTRGESFYLSPQAFGYQVDVQHKYPLEHVRLLMIIWPEIEILQIREETDVSAAHRQHPRPRS